MLIDFTTIKFIWGNNSVYTLLLQTDREEEFKIQSEMN